MSDDCIICDELRQQRDALTRERDELRGTVASMRNARLLLESERDEAYGTARRNDERIVRLTEGAKAMREAIGVIPQECDCNVCHRLRALAAPTEQPAHSAECRAVYEATCAGQPSPYRDDEYTCPSCPWPPKGQPHSDEGGGET